MIGTMYGLKMVVAVDSPSTALNTEMAGGDHAISVEQRGTKQAKAEQKGAGPTTLRDAGTRQSQQCHDAAFATIGSTQDQGHIFQ